MGPGRTPKHLLGAEPQGRSNRGSSFGYSSKDHAAASAARTYDDVSSSSRTMLSQPSPARSGRGRASSLSDVIRTGLAGDARGYTVGAGMSSQSRGRTDADELWLGGTEDATGAVTPGDILPLLDVHMHNLVRLFALYAQCTEAGEAYVGGRLKRHAFVTVQDLSRVLQEFDVVPTFMGRPRVLHIVAGVLSNPTREDAVVNIPTERGHRFSVGQLRWVDEKSNQPVGPTSKYEQRPPIYAARSS